MNIALIKKYSRQLKFTLRVLEKVGQKSLLWIILGIFSLISPLVHAEEIDPSFTLDFVSQSLVISQMNLPQSIETAIRQDWSERTRMNSNELQLEQFSRQTWPDGCLGLANSDEFCTQALVEGWRVVAKYQGKIWIYRTDETGMTVRLETYQ